ncbi:hypothetical protein [Polynucleobacter sp. MWH-UH25E]|uniref:hypothetical protein n=1 Tax=Polynucleobacter sp. MWH-UH25E TaxID=1855616 RepID=UPI001BFEA3E4|nr:hypothetical protein [Polynucleobacter sp. MWH-UH25E]QWD62181.1 hypothetical protein ICV39_00740 [Polynucleobacter sp. MWH-UH25E]
MKILIALFVAIVMSGCNVVCQDYTSGVVAKERQNFVLTEAEKIKNDQKLKLLEANLQAQIDAHNRGEWDSYFVSSLEVITRYSLLLGAMTLTLVIFTLWSTSKAQKKYGALMKLNEELNQKIQAGMEPIRVEEQKLEARKKKLDQDDQRHNERMSKQEGEIAVILANTSKAEKCHAEAVEHLDAALSRNAEIADANIKLIKVGQLVGNFDSTEAKRSIKDLLDALELVKSIKS